MNPQPDDPGPRVVYLDRNGNGATRQIVGWLAGIASVLVTASVLFAAGALYQMNGRMAVLESQNTDFKAQLADLKKAVERN